MRCATDKYPKRAEYCDLVCLDSHEDWDELVICSSMYDGAAEGTILKPKIGLLYSWQCLFLRHPPRGNTQRRIAGGGTVSRCLTHNKYQL